MALEILVDAKQDQVDNDYEGRGDIICVKLAGSPWGKEELKRLLVIRLSDSAIDALPEDIKSIFLKLQDHLLRDKKNGEPYPVITYPHSQTIEDSNGLTMARVSKRYIDISSMPQKIQDNILDPKISVPILEFTKSDLDTYFKPRKELSVSIGTTVIEMEDKI